MPLWLGWLIAGALLAGVGWWIAFYYRQTLRLSWRGALVALVIVVAVQGLILLAARH